MEKTVASGDKFIFPQHDSGTQRNLVGRKGNKCYNLSLSNILSGIPVDKTPYNLPTK